MKKPSVDWAFFMPFSQRLYLHISRRRAAVLQRLPALFALCPLMSQLHRNVTNLTIYLCCIKWLQLRIPCGFLHLLTNPTREPQQAARTLRQINSCAPARGYSGGEIQLTH
jgi:hypothetical protein